MPTAAKRKFVTRQSRARKSPSVSAPTSSSISSMLPPPTTPIRPRAILPSPTASTSNAMDLLQLVAATTDIIGEAPRQIAPAAPTSSHVSSTSNSVLTSANRGKRKHSALDDEGSSRKRSRSPPLIAKAQQEGSAALTSIAQILSQFIDSFDSSSSAKPERPPPTSLGYAIAALSDTEGLELDDVMLLTDYLSSNPNEAIVFANLGVPLWRASWAQRKLAAMRKNTQQ
jgi:hypothetical protein